MTAENALDVIELAILRVRDRIRLDPEFRETATILTAVAVEISDIRKARQQPASSAVE